MKTVAGPQEPRTCRARPSPKLRQQILECQNFCCLGCDQPLTDVEFDHVIPLGLGGGNAPGNWAALCPACHRTKTVDDLKRMAKARRQRRYHNTGRSKPVSTYSPFGGQRGFDKRFRHHLNGGITRLCGCPRCTRGGCDA